MAGAAGREEFYRVKNNRINQSVVPWCFKPMPPEERAKLETLRNLRLESAGGRAVPLAQIAMVAWNLPTTLPAGVEKGLEAYYDYDNVDSGWSQAVHCCAVEVDAASARRVLASASASASASA